jgi:NAD-dependent dihydropyrimidine dehydrogenase PreA subunit
VRGRAPIATRPPSRLVAGAAAARLPVVPSVSRAIAGTGGDAAGSNATRQAEESFPMTYVIAEPCVDVMDQACVAVCPVDCIHFEQGTDRTLYIDPNECIDCGACEPECPVNAIYPYARTRRRPACRPAATLATGPRSGRPVVPSPEHDAHRLACPRSHGDRLRAWARG